MDESLLKPWQGREKPKGECGNKAGDSTVVTVRRGRGGLKRRPLNSCTFVCYWVILEYLATC